MPDSHFEPLSYLDRSFLALETRTTHMHVGGVALFESNELASGGTGVDFDRVRAHVESKLQYIPRYRQRLDYVPYTGSPVWVDDDDFNLDYHVRHTGLPHPGSDDQLKRLAGRIVSQQLDRSKPLWELWVVEGLSEARFAIIAKLHHCMIDGLSGVDLTTILLNVTPVSEIEGSPQWQPRPAPTGTELAVASAARMTRQNLERLTSVGALMAEGRQTAEMIGDRAVAAMNSLRSGWLSMADATPLNPGIGPNRRFDWTETPLEDVRAVKNKLGGSVNDAVLAIVAGAVRQFLTEDRSYDVEGVQFRVMNPVSTRRADQRGALGNQVAMWLIDLPLDEPDPAARYEKIKTQTARNRRSNQALGAATLVEISRGTPLTLLSLANRVAGQRIRPFNMTVTNVPGPQFPMYLLEARMLATYPMVPLWAQHGLGVALFSYDGRFLWGIHADYDTLPDSDRFIAAIHQSTRRLLEVASV
ncbi:MAG TPA: wax ester/triacylglycerol synthase family O-acyltransferase [Acidimicrobiia bacterium]|nr:wax ester/triacylglycerol synthase family O-acyltransferase [Acidimicrobiia bacterium]